MPKAATKTDEISILEIHQGELEVCILGTSPLLYNRMSEKAKRELLLPKGRKTAADKAASLKHNPIQEFRDSVYRRRDHEAGPTRLQFPSTAFKGVARTAALDLPGTKKTEIGRLCWVVGERVDIYGIPILRMDVVKSADINRTPDIRTRACLAEWACRVTLRFVRPKLHQAGMANLLAAGGITCGIGDGRQEKGSLSNGQFRLVLPDDPDFVRLTQTAGMEAQDAALRDPAFWNEETEDLMGWFSAEVVKLTGRKEAA